jgi:hypothetical protein
MLNGRVRGIDAATLLAESLAHMDEYDLLLHGAALRGKPALVIGGWRDEGPTLEGWIIPLVRALRAAGAEHVTPVTVDDDHSFRNSRPEIHRAVIEWLRTACM